MIAILPANVGRHRYCTSNNHSPFGQQNAWPGRIDLDLFVQFADDDAQVMRVIEVRATLNLLHDLLTRHNLADFPRENLPHQIFLSTEDKYLPSIVPERVAKLISTAGSDDGIVRRRGGRGPYMWKGAKVAAGSFSPSCLCSRRRATQGAKGGICQGGRRGGSADRAAGRCQMQKLRKAWLSGLY